MRTNSRYFLVQCLKHLALMTAALAGGCSSLLPSVDESVDSGWTSYEDAKAAFDKIIPDRTDVTELKSLGFDPFQNSNIQLLNYLDLTQIFIPNASIRMADLHPRVRKCLKAKLSCQGYQIAPEVQHRQRFGNVVLDVFNFRRQTKTTGWKYRGLILLNDGLVVYKLESGQPKLFELEDKKNPLGPFQEITVSPDLKL